MKINAKTILFYAAFLVSWFFGAGLVVALLASLLYGICVRPTSLLYCLVGLFAAYAAERQLFPLCAWPAFKRACSFIAQDNASGGYFRKFQIIYDGVTQAELAGSSKRLMGFHPHGVLLCGWTMANAHAASQAWNCAWLATFWVTVMPVISEWMVWSGVQGASAPNMRRLMSSGHNLAIAVGGYEEATYYEHGKYRVFLKGRGGFIKYCLCYGYTIHPIFCFGEERTYHSLATGLSWRLLLNKVLAPREKK